MEGRCGLGVLRALDSRGCERAIILQAGDGDGRLVLGGDIPEAQPEEERGGHHGGGPEAGRVVDELILRGADRRRFGGEVRGLARGGAVGDGRLGENPQIGHIEWWV